MIFDDMITSHLQFFILSPNFHTNLPSLGCQHNVMSGWYFSETGVTRNNSCFLAAIAKLIYGVSVIGWILLSHLKEAVILYPASSRLINLLLGLWLIVTSHSNSVIVTCGIIIPSVLFAGRISEKSSLNAELFINFLFVLTCCAVLLLLPSFALYFADYHSVITLHNITVFTEKKTMMLCRYGLENCS